MKKKTFFVIGIIIVLLIGLIAYFWPLSLSDAVSESNQIQMILLEIGNRDGEPYIDSVDYTAITTEQKGNILSLFDKYTYKRTFGTLFSDGSISGSEQNILYIYVYDDVSSVDMFVVASSGKIVVNGRNYSMNDAGQLIGQIIQIVD